MDEFMGVIKIFAGNFAPRGWAFCEGQILSISQYQALFSLLGTTYGGDGRTTFALPDLRGRAPIHAGQGPGLSDIRLGESAGKEQISLNASNIPAHSHAVNVSNADGSASSPSGNFPAVSQYQRDRQSPKVMVNSYGNTTDSTMAANTIEKTGEGRPLSNRNPYLGVRYIIALEGIYPPRD